MALEGFTTNTDLAFGMQIADNDVIGTSDFFSFGRNPSLASNAVSYLTPNDGVHVPIEAPKEIFIYSTDAGDAGKFALVVGLDETYRERTSVFPIFGTASSSIGIWGAIHGVRIVGTEAIIGSLFASTAQNSSLGDPEIQAVVLPVDQQSFNLYYRVPTNRVGYAFEFIFTDYRNTGVGSTEFFLESRSNGELKTPWIRQAYTGLQVSGSNGFTFTLDVPLRLPPDTEIRIGAEANNVGHSAAVGIQIILRER